MRNKLAPLLALTLAFGIAVAATQWTLQPKQSKLTFVANQAGAPFEAVFEKFTADIKFDPKDLAGSRFDVKIDLNSVNSGDGERDDTVKGADLFYNEAKVGTYTKENLTVTDIDAGDGVIYSLSLKIDPARGTATFKDAAKYQDDHTDGVEGTLTQQQ